MKKILIVLSMALGGCAMMPEPAPDHPLTAEEQFLRNQREQIRLQRVAIFASSMQGVSASLNSMAQTQAINNAGNNIAASNYAIERTNRINGFFQNQQLGRINNNLGGINQSLNGIDNSLRFRRY